MGTFANSITKMAKKHHLALARNTNKDTEEVINKLDRRLIAYRK